MLMAFTHHLHTRQHSTECYNFSCALTSLVIAIFVEKWVRDLWKTAVTFNKWYWLIDNEKNKCFSPDQKHGDIVDNELMVNFGNATITEDFFINPFPVLCIVLPLLRNQYSFCIQCSDITWASWQLRSPVTWLLVEQLLQAYNCPFCEGILSVTIHFPSQRPSNLECFST